MITYEKVILLLLILLIIQIVYIIYTNNKNKKETFDIIEKLKNFLIKQDIDRLILKTREAIEYLKRDPNAAIGSLFKLPENKPLPEVEYFISKYSNYTVVNIDICKTPVITTIRLLMNLLTFGELETRMQERNIPDLFHLFMNITLINFSTGDMVQFRIEKDEVVKISPIRENQIADCLHVNLNREITFKEFMTNAIIFHPEICNSPFWIYDSSKGNCQIFVQSFMYGNNLNTSDLEYFYNQNAQQLLENLGFAKEISKKITDFYANIIQFIYL